LWSTRNRHTSCSSQSPMWVAVSSANDFTHSSRPCTTPPFGRPKPWPCGRMTVSSRRRDGVS
jgi:hypothetical protein